MAETKKLEIVAKVRDLVSGSTSKIRENLNRMAFGIQRSFRTATRQIFNMRNALLGLGVAAVGREFVQAASSVETFQMQLESLLGDEERATAVLADMRKFAAESPLETEKVIQTFVKLEAVGVSAAKEVTKTLGGISLLFNREMGDVASAFIGFEVEPLRKLGIELKRELNTAVLESGKGNNKIRIETENTAKAIRESLLKIWEE